MRPGLFLGVLAAVAMTALPLAAQDQPPAPKAQLNTLADVYRAISRCWRWPPENESRPGMELTVRVSFKRNGEIFGAKLTYQTRDVSDEERAVYYRALLAALGRCSPLPLSASLGEAIAGRPMTFHIQDTRQQRKA